MQLPPFIIAPFLATFLFYSWRHRGIDPARQGFNGAAGRMTVATIGAFGQARYGRNPGRVWRLSLGRVRISVASFAGACCLLRHVAPRKSG